MVTIFFQEYSHYKTISDVVCSVCVGGLKNRFALHTKRWNKIKYIFDYLDNDVLINCSTLDHPLISFVHLNVCTLKQWFFKYK